MRETEGSCSNPSRAGWEAVEGLEAKSPSLHSWAPIALGLQHLNYICTSHKRMPGTPSRPLGAAFQCQAAMLTPRFLYSHWYNCPGMRGRRRTARGHARVQSHHLTGSSGTTSPHTEVGGCSSYCLQDLGGDLARGRHLKIKADFGVRVTIKLLVHQ